MRVYGAVAFGLELSPVLPTYSSSRPLRFVTRHT